MIGNLKPKIFRVVADNLNYRSADAGEIRLKQFGSSISTYLGFRDAASPHEIVHGMAAGERYFDSQSPIAFAMLLLIATSTCRVTFKFLGYFPLRDCFTAVRLKVEQNQLVAGAW